MKIIITGGHLTPALAFIDYVQANHSDVNFTFLGRKYSRKEQKQISPEKTEVEKRNITFIAFDSGKLATTNPLQIIQAFFETILATFVALRILIKERPNVYLSFGSYMAVPVAFACWLLRIPIITHEQTKTVGWSTSLIAPLANKVAISYSSSKKHFPAKKTVLTGNPIRQAVMQPNTKPSWLTTKSSLPVLYVTGGSQGSEIINTTIGQSLVKLTKDWIVIHQCGSASETRNYKKELLQSKKSLSRIAQNRYFVREWLSSEELGYIYSVAECVISRSGANTIAELSYHAMPAILIPLPFAHNNEQYKNAETLAKTGGAFIIHQKNLTSETLLKTLSTLYSKRHACKRKLATITVKKDPAKKLFSVVKKVV